MRSVTSSWRDTSNMRPSLRRVWGAITFLWEHAYPAVFGAVTAVACLFWGYKLVGIAVDRNWHLDQIYSAALALVAITTGFLATFYGTIQSMTTGFIQQIRQTSKFRLFLAYVRQAIVIGFVVSVFTVPALVVQPMPGPTVSQETIWSALWLGSVVWALASFYRVASLMFFVFEARIDSRTGAS